MTHLERVGDYLEHMARAAQCAWQIVKTHRGDDHTVSRIAVEVRPGEIGNMSIRGS